MGKKKVWKTLLTFNKQFHNCTHARNLYRKECRDVDAEEGEAEAAEAAAAAGAAPAPPAAATAATVTAAAVAG